MPCLPCELPRNNIHSNRISGLEKCKIKYEAKGGGGKRRGLDLHANSKSHNDAMLLWIDSKKRETSSSTVENKLFKITSDQQKWLLAVFCVTRFLSANALPFRGDEDGDLDGDGKGTGLFQCAFSQLLFELEPKWKNIYKNMPGNAKYTSSCIQNETISVMADLVKRTITDDVRDAKLYTIMADGTTDNNRVEVQGLVCRYLSSTGIKEHCIDMQGVEDRSAKGVFAFIKNSLEKWELSFDGAVSQSYDGASVMSGQYNGLQALISQFTEREIVYVHCFLHKISLVVVEVMKQIPEICDYFGTASAMYNFFKKSAVLAFYEGSALKRLIATRWSGHHDSVKHIEMNFSEITQALAGVAPSKKLDSEERAISTGLLNQMCGNDDLFIFLTCMLNEILGPVNKIVKQLQSSTENIVSALSVVDSVRCALREDRENLSDEGCDKMVSGMKDGGDIVEVETKITRKKRSTQSRMDDYLVTGLLPSDKEDRKKIHIYAETLDLLENEFERRFAANNTTLWKAMEALHPSAKKFLNANALKPLFTYAKSIPVVKESFAKSRLGVDDLNAECKIFGRVLSDKDWPRNEHDQIDLVDVALYILSEHTTTAPVLSTLYRVGVTAGFTSTRVECLFSSLSRVDRAQRKSMLTKRECELSYLAFESSVLLKDITFEMFLKEWKKKPRHLFNI